MIVYTDKINDRIISHEVHMLETYKKAIKEYVPFFEKIGCSLKIGLMWNYFPRDTAIFQRDSFKNGYQCYVYCVVQRDGKEVCVESTDGEADYYTLSTAWMVSSIFRKCFNLRVTLYENIDDIDVDLKNFLSQLKHAK